MRKHEHIIASQLKERILQRFNVWAIAGSCYSIHIKWNK